MYTSITISIGLFEVIWHILKRAGFTVALKKLGYHFDPSGGLIILARKGKLRTRERPNLIQEMREAVLPDDCFKETETLEEATVYPLTSYELSEQFGGVWGSHPEHPVSDWCYEVSNGDTRLGYWDWVLTKLSYRT